LGVTASGREMVAKLRAARRRILSQALDGWTEQEIASLVRLLPRMARNLASQLPGEGG